jgi:hypothetical protein
MHHIGYESNRSRIVVYHITTKACHTLTEAVVDISFYSLLWSQVVIQ